VCVCVCVCTYIYIYRYPIALIGLLLEAFLKFPGLRVQEGQGLQGVQGVQGVQGADSRNTEAGWGLGLGRTGRRRGEGGDVIKVEEEEEEVHLGAASKDFLVCVSLVYVFDTGSTGSRLL